MKNGETQGNQSAAVAAYFANHFMSPEVVKPTPGLDAFSRRTELYEVSTPTTRPGIEDVTFSAEFVYSNGDDPNTAVTREASIWDGAMGDYVYLPVDATGKVTPERLIDELPTQKIQRAATLLRMLYQRAD
jgi:hypothetical protein